MRGPDVGCGTLDPADHARRESPGTHRAPKEQTLPGKLSGQGTAAAQATLERALSRTRRRGKAQAETLRSPDRKAVLEGASKEDAEKAKEQLEGAGATVTLK